MPQRNSRANGSNPFETARETIEREFNRLQKQIRTQSKSFEKRIEKGRRQIETRGRKQVQNLLAEIRESSVARRALAFGKDAQKQLESSMETVLRRLPVASRREVDRIDKQLRSVSKKVSDLEQTRGGRSAAASAGRASA